MMDKIWLIRTFDRKILGPITRDKLLNLLRDNKLSESDEVCPGNYHWVYVKEKKLLSEILNAPEIMGENVGNEKSHLDKVEISEKDQEKKKSN